MAFRTPLGDKTWEPVAGDPMLFKVTDRQVLEQPVKVSATDQCGNSTSGFQTISVIDTTKPGLTCPMIKVQCGADVPAPYADLAAFRASRSEAPRRRFAKAEATP